MLDLLLNVEVFAPKPLGVRHILVAGGKIVWIGDADPGFPSTIDVTRRDFAGRRAIPGLIDPHVHLTGGGGEAGPRTRVPPLGLSRFTRGGVTCVVGVLGTDDTTRHPADLVAATRGLAAEGLTAYCLTGGYHLPPVTVTGTIRGDIVHIDRILGVGEVALSDHRSSQPTLDELLHVAAEAHVGGLLSGKAGILHLHLGDGPRGLSMVREALERSEVPARVFNPTHVNRRRALFEEALELAQRGCTIDVTAFPVAEGEDAWSAAQALTLYLERGLPRDRITLSSDAGGSLPTFDESGRMTGMDVGEPRALAATLRELLRMGHALEVVLPAFTTNAARLLRLSGKGVIDVGADADIVILDDEGVMMDVMAGGQWHVSDGAVVKHGTFEGDS
ncbi:MAG TPA: beta-aspartyl-peptidase [Gemmatimonadales bacterium]|nr:beta-aspartyl-peptidase [Gemmatimonadales bacterium]